MNYDEKVVIPEALYLRFSQTARHRQDMRPIPTVLHEVMEQWIQHDFNEDSNSKDLGYQWKDLFLAHRTRARLHYLGKYYYAEVIEDDFVFAGESSSPNRIVVQVTGGRRNAWRDLWILPRGFFEWTQASVLRSKNKR